MKWRKWRHQRHLGWIVAVTGIVVFLIALFLISAVEGSHKHFDRTAEWAGIFSLPVTALGALIQFIAWLRPSGDTTSTTLDEQARLLAEAVLLAESRYLRRLIRGDYAAQVRFATDSARALKDDRLFSRLRELLKFSNEFGNDAGDLSNIAAYFQSLALPRMMVLGPPGAGKTILLISLVVQSLRDTEVRKAITVRVDLAGYDPLTLDLTNWLSKQLATQYPVSESVARRLVESGRVLPVLDGLDEMDNSEAAPVRALATLKRINSYIAGVELGAVLACRESEWERITSHSNVSPGFSIIHIQPLNQKQIQNYIFTRLAEESQDTLAWRNALRQVERNPTSPIAEVLKRPLWLGLAVIAFRLNPQDMFKYADSLGLKARLLAGFVSGSVYLLPHRRSPDKPRYHENDVLNWLLELADFLNNPQQGEGEAAEIVPDRLWTIAGFRQVRLLHTLLAITLGALALITVWPTLKIFAQGASPTLGGRIQGLIAATAVTGILAAVGIIRSSAERSAPPLAIGRLHFKRLHAGVPSAAELREWFRQILRKSFIDNNRFKWIVSFLVVLPVGAYILPGKHDFAIISTLLLAIVFIYIFLGVIIFIAQIATAPLRAIAAPMPLKPRRPYDALIHDRFVAVSGIAMILPIEAFVYISSPSSYTWSYFVSVVALTGLFVVLISRASVRYALAIVATAPSRRLPVRLKQFLNWSVDVGLLREAGPVYQFRHVELQRWLTEQIGQDTTQIK